MDNSWLLQNAFYNCNFTRKLPDSNKTVNLTPSFYGIGKRHHTLSVEELYPRGIFITKDDLENKVGSRLIEMNYNNLKNHIKCKIGPNRKYQAIPLRGSQRKGLHPTIRNLMTNNRSGSGVYRRILPRREKRLK